MSSIMRSESMYPTGMDFEKSVYDPNFSVIQEETSHDISGNVYTSVSAAAAPAKKTIMSPPMQYDLRQVNALVVYQHIKELTKNDQAASQYLEQLKPALYAPKPVVFGYIPAPPNEEITRKVIGTKGYFFKMTTTCCGVYFIWHDKNTNSFLFWGPSTFKTVKAMNSIRWRIIKYCELAKDESDDDMPALISMGNTPDYEHPEPC